MNKIFKTISICSLAFLAGLTITACGGKTTKKESTTKVVTTKKASTEGCSLNVEGLTDGLTIQFSGKIDGQTKTLDINEKYAAGTVVTARVTNNSTKKIKLTALDGSLIAGRDIIDPSATGAVFDITLSNNVKFKIEDASSITTASLDITGDDAGATSTKTNDIKVYSDAFVSGVDFTLADKLIVGETIKIKLLNYASDVELTIKNGTATETKSYKVAKEGNETVVEVVVNGDLEIEFETVTAKLTYDFSAFDDLSSSSVYYMDGTIVEIASNTDVPFGREVFIETPNMSDTNKYILQITDQFGYITKTAVIGADIDIITSFTMSEDTRCIEIIEYDEYNFSVNNTYSNVEIKATYLDGDDAKDITNKVPESSLVTIEGKNTSSTDKYIIKITMGEDTMVRALNAGETYKYEGIEMNDDISLEILPYSEQTVSIYNGIDGVEIKANVYYIGEDEPTELKNGDKVVTGAYVMVSARQPQGQHYGIKIINGTTVVINTTIKYDNTGIYAFNVVGDVIISVISPK